MWRKLSAIFLTGLAAVVPAVITIAIIWWFATTAESILGKLIMLLIPDRFYIPGMGLVAGIALVFVIGILLHAWFFRQIFSWGDGILNRIPFVKTVYGAARDLMDFVSGESHSQFNKVVLVSLPGFPARMLGLVTREDFSHLPAAISMPSHLNDMPEKNVTNKPDDDAIVSVYFPMSYTIGGYTLLLPRSALTPLDMTIEDAMRFAVTAGMSAHKDAK